MSNVLKALEQSESGFQQRSIPTQREKAQPQADTRLGYGWIAVALLPAAIILAWRGISTWQQVLENQQALVNQAPKVIEVPIAFTQLNAPQFDELKPIENISLTSSEEKPQSPSPSTTTSAEAPKVNDVLDGVDLSALPADLAVKVHSALSQQSKGAETHNALAQSDWTDLSQHGMEFTGKLMPLNFQTHVYSDNENKRWVKINGQEYTQGQNIDSQLELVEIRPQGSLLSFHGQLIFVPALYDWQG